MKTLVLIICVVVLMFAFTASANILDATNLVKPGCDSRCGDLIVPYPFGIGINSNCSINPGFDIYCNKSVNPPKAAFTKVDYASIKQISDSTLRISNLVATDARTISTNFTRWPYTLSEENKFTVIGCYNYAWLTSETKSRTLATGCMVICSDVEDALGDQCSGNGCCQSSIPKDISSYETQLHPLINDSDSASIAAAAVGSFAFVGEGGVFKFNGSADLKDPSLVKRIEATVPIVLEWAIGNQSCAVAEETDGFACLSNSRCVNSTRDSGGYRCVCNEGYQGNPYLPPGCQDINECNDVENKYPCYGTCANTLGSYTCKCKPGHYGDAKVQNGCRLKPLPLRLLASGLALGMLAIIIGLVVLYFTAKKWRLVKLREKFFELNGGVLLQNKLKNKGGFGVGSVKIFRAEELEEATKNYAEDRILGRGGNGVVYKGTLPDKRVVAIKKSLKLDQGQREQFINEMLILTQISHQNVVQLLGCCLETDVPLLVYEFVANDTLHHHIHDKTNGMGRISWNNRLRIAHESASALSYLHKDARMSIIHRDVKSSNILLDKSYTAKIADFGASRLVPLGHDQVTTLVQGTLGYLDPEYFHTGKLTSKSDVYSFGVVLAELLTSEKPLSMERCLDDRNLATYFVKAMKEKRLTKILDHQVVNEASVEQLKAAGDLVCRCLNQVGANRPSMKEVTMELETLRKFRKHPWISKENDKESSSLLIESEDHDLYTIRVNSHAFGEYGSSSNGLNKITSYIQNLLKYNSKSVKNNPDA